MAALEFPPGVVTKPTKAGSSVNWQETHLMRWIGDELTPVGGWEKLSYPDFASKVRKIHSWLTNAGAKYTAYLCESHCYVDDGSGVLLDISPTVPLEPPFANLAAGGYGNDEYSEDDYGTPRPDRPIVNNVPPVYTLDNWGEDLLVMTSNDGRLLIWSPAAPTSKLAAVTNAPISNRTFAVTPERHVMLFGYGGNYASFAWCDQEDIENWNFADVTSKAGFLGVEPASPIVTVCKTSNGILFFTTTKVFISRFVGLPYVYSREEVADATTPISPSAIAATAEGAMWFCGEAGFWSFNGTSVVPIDSPVLNWITDNYSKLYSRFESAAVNVNTLSEFWLFFSSSTSRINDRYVIFNYAKGWWATGFVGRTCGFTASYDTFPVFGHQFSVYRHESGGYYQGADLPWARTFAFNAFSGARLMTFKQMIPDVEGNSDNLAFSFTYRLDRSRSTYVSSPDKYIRSNGFVDVRVTGRDLHMTVKSIASPVERWTLGKSEIMTVPRGSR